jgi:hypothetical protein
METKNFIEQERKLYDWVQDGLAIVKSFPRDMTCEEFPVMDEIHDWQVLNDKLVRCFIDWYKDEAIDKFPENLQPTYQDWYKMFGEKSVETLKNYRA